jgi:subtilase family serine protease
VPTAVIPSPTIPPTVNLVAGIVALVPEQPRCNETFTVALDVANLGTTATTTGGLVSVEDSRASDGSVQQTTEGAFPVLQPNETVRIEMRLTVATWYNEDHRLRLVIDPANQIAETDENDNARELTYRLDKADCA